MHYSRQNTQEMRCMFSMARRPSLLIAISHSAQGDLFSMPLGELRLTRKAIDLAMRRERARSAMHHWSYDANRHIALKSARDRIMAEIDRRTGYPAWKRKKPRTNPRLEVIELQRN